MQSLVLWGLKERSRRTGRIRKRAAQLRPRGFVNSQMPLSYDAQKFRAERKLRPREPRNECYLWK